RRAPTDWKEPTHRVPAAPVFSACKSACAASSRATIEPAWRSSSSPASVGETGRGPPGRGDLLADRGLGVAEPGGRPAERALLGHRLQGREVADLDPQPAVGSIR